MIRIQDANQFRYFLLYGLNEYKKVRVESFTGSISFENKKDIKKSFLEFVYDLGFHKWGHSEVQYCIVVVRDQHIHGFLKKPYQTPQFVREKWQLHTGEISHVKILTLRESTREDPVQMGKMISYFAEQSQKHDCDTEFYRSDMWGIVSKEDREAIERKKNKLYRPEHPDDIKFKKKESKKIKRKFDPVVMIEGKFYYESQLTSEQKEILNKKYVPKVGEIPQSVLWEQAAKRHEETKK